MATREECEAAVHALARALGDLEPEVRQRAVPSRSVSLVVPDLGLAWAARLGDSGVSDLRAVDPDTGCDGAQLRFVAGSDDVVAVARRPGSFAVAWLRGRVSVHAGIRDLLALRRLL